MRRVAGFLVLAIGLALGPRAEANFIISFPTTTTIQAGNTTPTQIVATISGTSTDVVDEFNLSYLITRDPANPITPVAFPSFVSPTTASDPTFNDPKYIFNNGNSLFAGTSPFGSASNPGTGFNTRFSGGDLSIADVTVTSSNNHLTDLLVNSTVSTTTNLGGDLYILSIDLANSQFYHGNHILIPSTSISASTGSIRVMSGLSPVPEPAALSLGLIAAALLSGSWLYRRKGRAA